jgi:hypothetical protein
MLRALGPRAQSVRLLTSHCVTCMSSPSNNRSIDDTIESQLRWNTSLNSRGVTESSCRFQLVPAGRSTLTRASEAKFESAASCVMRSERIRQEVQCIPEGLASRVWLHCLAKILTRCQNLKTLARSAKGSAPAKGECGWSRHRRVRPR